MKRLILFMVVALLLSGCSNSNSGNQQCSIAEQNSVWFSYLQDWYLFYQDLPSEIDPNSYASVAAMLEAVRSSQDRFSYIITKQDYDAFFNSGSYFGYGFSLDTEQVADAYVIRYVFSGSGADNAGLQRGDQLISINGYSVTEIKQQSLDSATVYGPDQDGYTISVTYRDAQSNTITTDIVKGVVTTNTVFDVRSFNTSAGTVGYLSFQHGFIEPSENELSSAFATLSADNPEQLILDLRYNGGGRISIAQQLASLIGGDNTAGEVFGTLTFNDKHTNENSTYSFVSLLDDLNITRLIVLTTDNTCSASEMVINGLMPFLDVVVVGGTTCGKPIGMSPQEYCEMVMSAINFKVTNANDYGEYFDGLTAQCSVADQIVADWGSLDDPLLAEGIYFAENSSCSNVVRPELLSRSLQSQELPTYQSILFGNRY
ncbi:MAG: PDZ domain-containing protein [Gammaproteobacteria bacterium]|nr:PDZ domain-containing protein [Gammaproteobacteria bacterium]